MCAVSPFQENERLVLMRDVVQELPPPNYRTLEVSALSMVDLGQDDIEILGHKHVDKFSFIQLLSIYQTRSLHNTDMMGYHYQMPPTYIADKWRGPQDL